MGKEPSCSPRAIKNRLSFKSGPQTPCRMYLHIALSLVNHVCILLNGRVIFMSTDHVFNVLN
jgi:hypothetical protein